MGKAENFRDGEKDAGKAGREPYGKREVLYMQYRGGRKGVCAGGKESLGSGERAALAVGFYI